MTDGEALATTARSLRIVRMLGCGRCSRCSDSISVYGTPYGTPLDQRPYVVRVIASRRRVSTWVDEAATVRPAITELLEVIKRERRKWRRSS